MKDLSPKVIDAIKEYQVPGCATDFDETDFNQNGIGVEWSDHVAGTVMYLGGTIFLGMPKGFDRAQIRLGRGETEVKINIFTDYNHFQNAFHGYDLFNVPVWKYKNEKGHTFVRGISPRINTPFIHVILEDCMDQINCHELTPEELDSMD